MWLNTEPWGTACWFVFFVIWSPISRCTFEQFRNATEFLVHPAVSYPAIVSVVIQIPCSFQLFYFFLLRTNISGIYTSRIPRSCVGSFFNSCDFPGDMFEMQVCRARFGQWKGKDEMLPSWVQISCAILPNLHLWGHSYCRILCILSCHILFFSRALTLNLEPYIRNTPLMFQSSDTRVKETHLDTKLVGKEFWSYHLYMVLLSLKHGNVTFYSMKSSKGKLQPIDQFITWLCTYSRWC